MTKTPVLLIVFNRLGCAQRVFDSVREFQPSELYIAADGPRNDRIGEDLKCNEVREWLLNHVDWECNVHTRFLDENVGCGYGPSSAISWFFENVEEGVILEDDCIPTQQFFRFATEMLERYRNDNRIMVVDSINMQNQKWGDGSYYFSKQTQSMCAWATWRRAWNAFEFTLKDYSVGSVRRSLKWYGADKMEIRWWVDVFKRFKAGEYGTSSWDYQFIYAIWRHHGMAIIPNVNMSSNVGFGQDATHTTTEESPLANRSTQDIYPLTHPSEARLCQEADTYYHNLYYKRWQEVIPWHKQIKRYIKRLIGYKK